MNCRFHRLTEHFKGE